MNSPDLYQRILLWALIAVFVSVGSLFADQERELAYLMTYGTDAGIIEGDDDFVQIVFIKIPQQWTQTLYIRIFDADCGGRHDEMFSGKWDTRTRYRLFGGISAFSPPGLNHPSPSHQDRLSGELLFDYEFGEDAQLDNQWYTLARVDPADGEPVGDFRYFKLIIEGRQGNDGNAYLIAATPRRDGHDIPETIEIFSFKPTIRLPRAGVFSEMRFLVPQHTREITVHNFDLSGAKIGVDTVFRTNLTVPSSGQGRWIQGVVQLNENEVGRMCAIRFEGGREMPNDGTFYVRSSAGRLLPIRLTVYLQTPNLRPKPRIEVTRLSDCLSFRFDGARTRDREGDDLKFDWDFGDGHSEQGVTVQHQYTSPGQYFASVVIQDDAGQIHNSVIERFTVSVNHPPVAIAGANRVAAPREQLVFDGSASYDSDGRIDRYQWDFGDGRSAVGLKVTHQYAHPGRYPVTLRVVDDSNTPCQSATDTMSVVINAPPVVNPGVDRKVSAGQTIQFSGNRSHDPDGRIIAYEWNMGDWTRKSGMDVTHVYQKPGTYPVDLNVTDDSGAKNASQSGRIQVIVNQPPLAVAGGPYKGSVAETIILDGTRSRDHDGRIIAWEWDFGDGSRSKVVSGQSPRISHIYQKPDRYRVTLTVRDDSGTSTAETTDTAWVTINHPPVAKAGPDLRSAVGQVQFNAGESWDPDGRINEYIWDFGDGSSGRGPRPTHVYQSPGSYTVRLTVVDDSATASSKATDEMIVTVNHLPIADAGHDRVGIPNQPMTFDASASIDPDGKITKYAWDFGDGSSAEGVRLSHSYHKPGRYTAHLTVRDDSGQHSAVGFDGIQVMINHPPIAIAGADLKVAANEMVVFDGRRSYDPDGTIAEYRWEFSDQKSMHTRPKLKRSFSKPGIYTATLSVVDNLRIENSTAQDKVNIRVNHPPVANGGKDILTDKRTVVLDASKSTDADGDVLSYAWDFGDGTPPKKGMRVYHTYAKGGSYPVILTVDDGTGLRNSQTTTSITVEINDPPTAKAGGNRTICAGKPILFDGSYSVDPEGGRLKYHWDFGDSSTADVVNPAKIYDNGGIYLVTLTVTDDSGLKEGSVDTDQIAVTVVESPVAEAGENQTVCAGAPIQFDGTRSRDVDGLVNRYHWNFGDGNVGGGPTPTHTYDQPGTYHVALTITGDQLANCNNTDVDEMVVTVHQAPQAEILSADRIEFGQPVTFTAQTVAAENVQITEYQWVYGDGNRGSGKTVAHTYAKPGNYLARLTVFTGTATACNHTTRQKQIIVNAPPTARASSSGIYRSATKDYLVGVNQVVVFNGAESEDPDGLIQSYRWHFGDDQSGNGAFVRHQYRAPGQYKVVLTVNDNTGLSNSMATDTLVVTVNAAPKPVISGGGIYCRGETVTFDAAGTVDPDGDRLRYVWNFGDGTADVEGSSVDHVYRYSGKFNLNLLVDDQTNVSNGRVQINKAVMINEPPYPDAGVDRLVSPGDRVVFDAAGTVDRDGKVKSFQWDLGDGSRKNGKRVTHRYQASGVYKVTLTVTDDSGTSCAQAQASASVRVNATPKAVIKGDADQLVDAHTTLVFDATGSYDPDNDPLSFSWRFGDGNQAEGPKVAHRYAQPGTYTVTLRVDDGNRLKSSSAKATQSVRVKKRE